MVALLDVLSGREAEESVGFLAFVAEVDVIEEADEERSGFSEIAVCFNSFRAAAVAGSSEEGCPGGVGLRLCRRSAIFEVVVDLDSRVKGNLFFRKKGNFNLQNTG